MRFVARVTIASLSIIALAVLILFKPWSSSTRHAVARDPHVELMGDLWDPVLFPPEKKEEKRNEDRKEEPAPKADKVDSSKSSRETPIRLSVVACGDRGKETLVLLKTAAMFSKSRLFYHLFAEDHVKVELKNELDTWPDVKKGRIGYDIHPITFPESQNAEEWKKIFKLCATQRLFLPSLLKDVDSLIYLDTDILFLTPVERLWSHFALFNSTHAAALAPEGEDRATGWYNRFARHPYYGPLGVNSGIMLMNLTRLRKTRWEEKVIKYYKEYKSRITWGDQDLINVIFHFHPDLLYVYPCEWNFRPDHCRYKNACPGAEKRVHMVHGNRQLFHNNKEKNLQVFNALYDAFDAYRFGDDLTTSVKRTLHDILPRHRTKSGCGEVVDGFLAGIDDAVLAGSV